MKSPENIQELIHLLSISSKTHYNDVLNSFDFSVIDFKPFESWSSDKYTRNCLYKDAQFELLLLCWDEGQETSIHDHDGEDCWVFLIEGEMEEIFYAFDASNQLQEEHVQCITPNQLSFINDRVGFHKLKNKCKGRSMSLHVYAKPIEQCQFYCKKTKQFVGRKLKYDTHMELMHAAKSDSI